MPKSEWELLFAQQVYDARLSEPDREYRFHPSRRWRFDFAWPREKIAVEIEGGVYSQGRHTRGRGFTEDCIKYNAAAALGWRVFRYPSALVEDGSAIKQITNVLCSED